MADTIAQAAPTYERTVVPDAVTSDAVTFDAGAIHLASGEAATVDVEVPVDAGGSVTIKAGDGSKLEVSLPDEVTVADAQVADDGTVVYTDTGADAHAAVQTLDDGSVRLQTILESDDASKTFTCGLGDVIPVLLDDGSVELTQEVADGILTVVGTVDAPWAIDANGERVNTWYTVGGNELVQHVNPTADAVYPITADPKITRAWWNTTIYVNRNETALLAGGYNLAAAGLLVIPEGVSKVLAAVVAGGAAYISTVHGMGKCLKAVSYGHLTTPVLQPYWGAEAGYDCR
ncbi:hypothetical protein [Demequina sp.]|uniref:hypothetical protein n=1 Tax=Demequina sp. TaxID=2050685 RepID=UPI003A85F406